MKAFLIYPFGSSDLQRADGSSLADDLQQAVGLVQGLTRTARLSFSGGAQRGLELASNGQVVRLPLLGDTLFHLARSNARLEIALKPILSQQDPREQDDTAPLMPFLEALSCRWNENPPREVNAVRLAVLQAWVLKRPADQNAVLQEYEGFFQLYSGLAKQYGCRFFQITCGTPQMSHAAVRFGVDPDLQFLYTPRNGATCTVDHPARQQRAATDRLVARLVEGCDWGGAAEVWEQPGNGYSPLGDAMHPLASRIALARALHAWSRRQYAAAAKEVSKIAPDFIDISTRKAYDSFVSVIQSLSRDPHSVQPAGSRGDVPRCRLIDAYNQLLRAALTEDPGQALVAIDWFHDAWFSYTTALTNESNWMIYQDGVRNLIRESPPGRLARRLLTVSGRSTLDPGNLDVPFISLMWWNEEHEECNESAIKPVLENYFLLHWVQHNYDVIRNEHIHGVPDFSPGVPTTGRGGGGDERAQIEKSSGLASWWVLVGLARAVMSACGCVPDDDEFVGRLTGALVAGEATWRLPVSLEEVQEAAGKGARTRYDRARESTKNRRFAERPLVTRVYLKLQSEFEGADLGAVKEFLDDMSTHWYLHGLRWRVGNNDGDLLKLLFLLKTPGETTQAAKRAICKDAATRRQWLNKYAADPMLTWSQVAAPGVEV